MPFGKEGLDSTIGFALSGGGFRATLFHLGSLWRLNELGILPKLNRISSISGGSITAGLLAEAWSDLAFSDGIAKNFDAKIVEPLRKFCSLTIDVQSIGESLLLPGVRASEKIEAAYETHLVHGNLQDLEDEPRFIFGATNLQTGRSFRFSKRYMGDYRLGLIRNPTLPLAKVIAASSAFPPFLSPVILENPGTFEEVEGADLCHHPEYTQTLYIADGGVYDNLGLETVWNRCQTVLVSDAGAPFSVGERVNTDWIRQSLRALDVATDQARALRKRALISDYVQGMRSGAYWGIDTDITDYGTHDALECTQHIVSRLATIRTRLNTFDDRDQTQLINWGYAVCDAAIRRHSPDLLPEIISPPRWPFENERLHQR